MNLSPIPWDFLLIMVVLGVIVPWRGAVRVKRLLSHQALDSRERLLLYASTIAFQWLIAGFIAWRALARNLSPEELGLTLTAPGRTILTAALLTAALSAIQLVSLRQLARIPPSERGFMAQFTEKIMPHNSVEALFFIGLACTAGVSEEFIYRGFVYSVLHRILGNSGVTITLAAAVFSSALFAFAHLYQGRRGIITTFVVALIFMSARLWTDNLLTPVIAHSAVDLVAGLCARRILVRDSEYRTATL